MLFENVRHIYFLQSSNCPLQDDARKSRIALKKANESDFGPLPHPPYSPNLVPSAYHLFSHIKYQLQSHKLKNDNEAKHAVIKGSGGVSNRLLQKASGSFEETISFECKLCKETKCIIG